MLAESSRPFEEEPAFVFRRRLVQSADLPFPVVLEQLLRLGAPPGEEQSQLVSSFVANQILVSSKATLSDSALTELAELIGCRLLSISPSGFSAVLETESLSLDAVDSILESLPSSTLAERGLHAERNAIAYTLATPNDPRFSSSGQWSLQGSAGAGIDAPLGWNIRMDASDIIVAVLDTGVRLDHEDLVANFWTNPRERAANGLDDDQNGYADDVHGANALTGSGHPHDDNGHGTHVAGIVAARGNNGVGIAGVAWKARLMIVKAFYQYGRGTTSDVVESLDYAVYNGAKLINASWGMNHSVALEQAVDRAGAKNVLIVAAAGNDGVPLIGSPSYPASFDKGHVVAVASVDRSGSLSDFSNHGRERVLIAAPGRDILSTWHSAKNAYTSLSGTSMAAPIVTGVLALNYAERPHENIQAQIDRLRFTAAKKSELASLVRAGGIVNLHASLSTGNVSTPPELVPETLLETTLLPEESLLLECSVESRLTHSLQWYLNGSALSGERSERLEIASVGAGDEGRYTLVATNADGRDEIAFHVEVLERDPAVSQALDTQIAALLVTEPGVWKTSAEETSQGGSHIALSASEANVDPPLLAVVDGPATVRFRWRMPPEASSQIWCEEGDRRFRPRAVEGWQINEIWLSGDKDHRLTWRIEAEGVTPNQTILELDDLQIYPLGEAPPVIVKQPEGITTITGESIYLEVEAFGYALRYQWFKDGVAIEGANKGRYYAGPLTEELVGEYHVTVSNNHTSVESETATIAIQDGGVVARFLESGGPVAARAGESITLAQKFEGSEPMSYQWYKNGAPIPGATEAELVLDPATMASAGRYVLKLANPHAEAMGDPLFLSLEDRDLPPLFAYQASHAETVWGKRNGTAAIEFQYRGSEPTVYQWFKDGVPVDGPQGARWEFDELSAEDAGEYSLETRNSAGIAQSHKIDLRVVGDIGEALDLPEAEWEGWSVDTITESSPPNPLGEPYDGTDVIRFRPTPTGHSVSVIATVTGPANLSFYWKRSSDSSSFLTCHVQGGGSVRCASNGEWQQGFVSIPAGAHRVEWTHYSQSPSDLAWLDQVSFAEHPVFADLPNAYVPATDPVRMSATAFGSGTIGYQWLRNGEPIDGASESAISLPSGSYELSDVFAVRAFSEHGEVRSHDIRLVTAQEIFEGLDPSFRFGGAIEWQTDYAPEPTMVDRDSFGIFSEDQGSGWMGFEATGPAVFSFANGLFSNWSAQATIDGAIAPVHATGFGSPSPRRYISIPEDRRTARIEVTKTGTREGHDRISRLKHHPSPFIFDHNTRFDPLNGRTASFHISLATSPNSTIRWYKDDVLYRTETGEALTLTSPFEEGVNGWSAETGVYHCEVVDNDGNTARSKDIVVVRKLDSEEVLGMAGCNIESGSVFLSYDEATRVEGERSLRGDIAEDEPYGIVYLTLPPHERERPFRIRIKAGGPSGKLHLSDGRGVNVAALGEGWAEHTLYPGGSGLVRLRFEKPIDEELSFWIDGLAPEKGLVILSQPDHYATYLGADVKLAVEAFSEDELGYQWFQNGKPIQNATAAELELTNLRNVDLGTYHVVVSDGASSRSSRSVEVSLASALAAAVEQPGVKVTTWGDSLWRIDPERSVDGSRSLTSGPLAVGQSSAIRFEFGQRGQYHYYSFSSLSETDLRNQFWTEVAADSFESEAIVEAQAMGGEERYGEALGTNQVWIDRLAFHPVPHISYDLWAEQRLDQQPGVSLAEPLVDRNADSDQDGIPNLFEFGLKLDPLVADKPPALRLWREGAQIAGEITHDFIANPSYNVSIEFSHNFVDWYAVRSAETKTTSYLDPRYETIESRLLIDHPTGQPLFARWRIASTGFNSPQIQRTHSVPMQRIDAEERLP